MPLSPPPTVTQGVPAAPAVRYARNADGLHIAYLVVGNGPLDVVYVSNWTSNVELFCDSEPFNRLVHRLVTFARVIVFDQPGTGLSDPVALDKLPTMEQWMDDVRIVLDAVGSKAPAFYAHDSAAPLALTFAATHPDRVSALVLVNAYARMLRAPDYPHGHPAERSDEGIRRWLANWTTGAQLAITAPSVAGDPQEIYKMGRAERHSASPGVAAALFRMINDLDVRHVLPAVHVPTLVMHASRNRWIRVGHGRYLAEHIAGARYVEVDSEDHWIFYRDLETYLAEIQQFLTGVEPEPRELDRTLLTLLFTDIVDSTRMLTEVGDARWKALLNDHDRVIRAQIERFRGREVETAGDSFLVAFDGPARAIRCAAAICAEAGALGLKLRTGLHTGECERRGEQLGGIAVHVAARVMAEAGPGEVLVSSTVKDLVAGSGLAFEERGTRTLKGAGDWRLYAVRA